MTRTGASRRSTVELIGVHRRRIRRACADRRSDASWPADAQKRRPSGAAARDATARETPMSDAATVRSSPIYAGSHRGLAVS